MHILIVAHDAGGAEIVSAWVKANPQNKYSYILYGPAVAIFSRKTLGTYNQPIEKLLLILLDVEFVLTGTSWGSDLEREVIKTARRKNIFVASYLDHWVNYSERFLYQGTLCLPNEIWVGDKNAEDLAKDIFKQTPVHFVPNQYVEEVKRDFKKIVAPPRSEKYNLLYICEPVEASSVWKTGNKNERNYTEYSALQFFFDEVVRINLIEHISEIKLRLHPSETLEKYDQLIENVRLTYSCKILVSDKRSLLEDYSWADCVVGISSMALIIAEKLEKNVFTCIPANAIVPMLPLKKIQQFNENLQFLEKK